MAERRMFAKTIVESGAFYKLSAKAQCLYLHLCMNADDDGLLNNAMIIYRSLGFSKTVLQELIDKRFLLDCGDDIICIKHWLMNNMIAKDRYKPTVYKDVLQKLYIKDNKSYTDRLQIVNKSLTQSSIDKLSIDKNSLLDDEIKIYNERLLESGIDRQIIDNAIHYYKTINCPRTNDFYLKILDICQDETILNKYAYISEVARNEQNREVQA